MGMIVSVYRNSLGDCTNGGISKTADQLCVVNCDGPFSPRDDLPAVLLEISKHGVMRLIPAQPRAVHGDGWEPTPGWFMNGGNFGSTSDQRFCELVTAMGGQGNAALPIFDRQEH